ncbi:MAG: hypothetical protein VYD27_05060 [Candidatus Thermoplasmatota archaeon]|nr:hypothetical protein [Candidatus Thermoplasmatota archaeon]|tara:strand:- start:1884 stop:2042 length:159 start_codon:yes stop_codon:yes gene_type:complete
MATGIISLMLEFLKQIFRLWKTVFLLQILIAIVIIIGMLWYTKDMISIGAWL